MLVVDLRTSLASVTFGWSLLGEISASLRAAGRVEQPAWIRDWWHDVRSDVVRSRLSLLHEQVPSLGFLPEFLLPLAKADGATLDEDLHTLVRTPSQFVVSEVAALEAGSPKSGIPAVPRPLAMDIIERHGETAYLETLAQQLESYWKLAIEPYWRSFRQALDGEIRYRGRALAQTGVGATLATLSPHSAWKDGLLMVNKRHQGYFVAATGAGLHCTASVFMYGDVIFGAASNGSFHFHYPARGLGVAWEHPPRAASSALAALIGGVRAAVLADLEQPTTTGDLARRHKLSASTVSYHLGVLYRAGLLERDRDGKEVHYQRNSIGDALST